MGVLKDTKATLLRSREYGVQIKGLLSRRQVHSVNDLKRVARNSSFQNEVTALWAGILKAEGGKMSLTFVLSTIGLAMGGVGIAAGGGAIGLPLLMVLAPAGYFAGQELDSEGYTKSVVDRINKVLHKAGDSES
jgi:hypothetical protein